MNELERIKEMLCEELYEYAKKTKLTGGDLETIHKLTDTIKNIDKIDMLEEDGYSRDGGWMARGMYGNSYEGGESYARRKRDRMGRYSRDGYSEAGNQGGGQGGYGQRGSYRGYSRDGAKDYMMEQLEEMMEGASGKEREALKRCMETMRGA